MLPTRRMIGIEVFNHVKSHAVEYPEMPYPQIIKNMLQLVPSHMLPHLPKRPAVKHALSRQRQAELPADL
jgi:hypothetical protein